MGEEAWKRDHVGGMKEDESLKKDHGHGSLDEESWTTNAPKRHPKRHPMYPVGTQESPKRHSGGTQEAPTRHPRDTQEAPQRHQWLQSGFAHKNVKLLS